LHVYSGLSPSCVPFLPYTTLFRSAVFFRHSYPFGPNIAVFFYIPIIYINISIQSPLFETSVSSSRPCRCRTRRSDCQDVASSTRSEEHTSELQSRDNLVCGLLLET